MNHLRYWIFTMIIGVGLAVFGGERSITFNTYNNGSIKCINIENYFYKITIVPDCGGKVYEWFDKLNNTALTRCKIPQKPDDKVELGGMLDDRGTLSFAKYE